MPFQSAFLQTSVAVVGHLRRDRKDGIRAYFSVTFSVSSAFSPGCIIIQGSDLRHYGIGLELDRSVISFCSSAVRYILLEVKLSKFVPYHSLLGIELSCF